MLGGEGLRDDAQACLDTDSDTAVTNLYFLLMQQFGFSHLYYNRALEQLQGGFFNWSARFSVPK